MRAGLAILAVLALAAQPAFAQGKTKTSPIASALSALETCEAVASGDETALETARAAGWDVYAEEGESPFIKSYSASLEMAGLGWGELFSLVETYPGRTFGYCRINVAESKGNGAAVIDAIMGLDRYDGDVLNQDGGHYASLIGGDSLLLAHWDDFGFVVQVSTLTLNPAEDE
ncbi:hypothetical protein [Devosia faecipullorum]|uniref:hypothetical protein n=1 Tax=Devosia faecipullorum TaxID=2755039 RepID=UPI00187B4083|nr:hypothetical protein [Devosia faecipullorum]MBE7732531.1 hypothetical protein [Devosia faecipullorum]